MKEALVKRHASIMQGAIWLAQLRPKQEKKLLCLELADFLGETITDEGQDHLTKAYIQDSRLDEDSLDINDFFYHICKSLAGSFKATILSSKSLNKEIFDVFHNFVKYEYDKKEIGASAGMDHLDDNQIIENITKANTVESVANKSHRHQSFATLRSFLELFRQSETLKRIPNVEILQSVLLSQLSAGDVKNQRIALECLIRTGY